MTSRAASPFDANDEQPPTKRPRIQEEDTVACFDSLNDDCLLHILAHTATADLNSFAICSRRCQQARAHESLDQARTGIITVSEGCTFESLCKVIVQGNWDEGFQGNQTSAIIDGLERLDGGEMYFHDASVPRRFQLSGVTKLQLKSSPGANKHYATAYLAMLFPNLQEIDCTSLNIRNKSQFSHQLYQRCPNLNKFTWNGADDFSLLGTEFVYSPHPADLCLDGCQFELYLLATVQALSNSSIDRKYMLVHCPHLERLSIKNATWTIITERGESDGEIRPVSQEMLIKMVRCHQTLRWLRSDLSEDNVRMLQQERPEITFVSR